MRSASREARVFRSAIAAIKGIDRHELIEAEVITNGFEGSEDWSLLQHDPIRWILTLNDDRLDRFYELLEGRS